MILTITPRQALKKINTGEYTFAGYTYDDAGQYYAIIDCPKTQKTHHVIDNQGVICETSLDECIAKRSQNPCQI